MAEIGNLGGNVVDWAKTFWAGRPDDILLLGFIVGFFVGFSSWQNKHLGSIGGFLLSLRNISNVASIFAAIGMVFYILVTIAPEACVYYIAALLLGMGICWLFLRLLRFLSVLGDIVGTAFSLASGPAGVFAVWLFNNNELLPEAEKIFGEMLKFFP
ncbi:MAG: hypothetical protein LBO03_01175 [Acidaminococcales bacterium]|jgi:hypothetical protein|nr:hypothetical protein [Acidaminococcales bacterium]